MWEITARSLLRWISSNNELAFSGKKLRPIFLFEVCFALAILIKLILSQKLTVTGF